MKTVLVIGATGLLGQSLMAEATKRGLKAIGLAKSGANIACDISDDAALLAALRDAAPDTVVNTAAIVDIGACEADPGRAYRVNARPASILAAAAVELGYRNVFISTDHYYVDSGDRRHDEMASVTLVNEYARSKYVGERLALMDPQVLVVRTNIVGHRRRQGAPAFAEWAIAALLARSPMTLFDDVFSSPIHVRHLSAALFDLLDAGASGVINVASSEVSSKKTFIEALGRKLGAFPDWAETGSGRGLKPRRADSMGLDVSRAEGLLGYPLPGLAATIDVLAAEHRDG